MNLLIATLCLIALCNSLYLPDVTQASQSNLERVKRHTGTLTRPKNNNEAKAFSAVVAKWSNWGGAGRAAQRKSELFKAKVGNAEARIDLQDVEQIQRVNFDRLNAQIEGRSLAAVHIQQGLQFGVALIRESFLQSEKHGAHVFLSGPEITDINPPSDNKSYRSKMITRKWDGKLVKSKIWSVNEALNELAKFDKSTGTKK